MGNDSWSSTNGNGFIVDLRLGKLEIALVNI